MVELGVQTGVCVLMLYSSSEFNNLAVSLQYSSTNASIIATGTWLQTNVKMFSVQAGDIEIIDIE